MLHEFKYGSRKYYYSSSSDNIYRKVTKGSKLLKPMYRRVHNDGKIKRYMIKKFFSD